MKVEERRKKRERSFIDNQELTEEREREREKFIERARARKRERKRLLRKTLYSAFFCL